MSIEAIGDWFLAGFFSFVAVYYVVTIAIKKRRFRQPSLVNMGKPFTSHWWNHAAFRLFRALIWGVCVIRLFYPGTDQLIGFFPSMADSSIQISGCVFLLLGFTIAAYSGKNLKENWRSGIYADAPKVLVINGLYKYSRNPAFIGVGIAQLGFFLALPSIFSLVCLIVGLIALRVQTGLEEKHLRESFGQAYSDYHQHTPRWL